MNPYSQLEGTLHVDHHKVTDFKRTLTFPAHLSRVRTLLKETMHMQHSSFDYVDIESVESIFQRHRAALLGEEGTRREDKRDI